MLEIYIAHLCVYSLSALAAVPYSLIYWIVVYSSITLTRTYSSFLLSILEMRMVPRGEQSMPLCFHEYYFLPSNGTACLLFVFIICCLLSLQ